MSGPEAPKPDDRLLDEFLAGQGAVRESYRAVAQQQPPPALDAAILRAASAAAAAPLRRAPRARWQTPMAAAAVLVLSFGVLLQLQRDPVAQQQLQAPPVAAAPEPFPAAAAVSPSAPAEMAQDAAKAEAVIEAAPKPEPAAAAKKRTIEPRKPASSPAESRRTAPAASEPMPPPPPPAAVADRAAMAQQSAAESERAEMSHEAAAAGAAASAFMPSPDTFAATPPTMGRAKASRAPLTAKLMREADAPVTSSDASLASAIERWALSCEADTPSLSVPMLWRGLAVVAWTAQREADQGSTLLQFAPEVTAEAIRASLGSLAGSAMLNSVQCPVPVRRELRQSNGSWALVCECTEPAAE